MSNPNQPPYPPADWYPDPAGSQQERYWDGTTWTASLRPREVSDSLYGPALAPSPYIPVGAAAYGGQPAPGPRYAHWGWRVLAAIIDYVLVQIIIGLLLGSFTTRLTSFLERWKVDVEAWMRNPTPSTMPLFWEYPGFIETFSWLLGLSVAITIGYHVAFLVLFSATPGKLAVGTKVVMDRPDSSRVTPVGAIVRQVASQAILIAVPVAFFSLLAPLWTDKRQTFHDMLAKTVVIKVW